jgi:hypothetical protein
MDDEKIVDAQATERAGDLEGNKILGSSTAATQARATNEVSYSTGLKLTTITIAIALSVLFVALVRTFIFYSSIIIISLAPIG